MTTLEDKSIWEDGQVIKIVQLYKVGCEVASLRFISCIFPLYLQPDVSDEVLRMNTDDIVNRTKLMENEIKVNNPVYSK